MPKSRTMGAGLAGSSAYRSRTQDQGGGNKLQGLPPLQTKTYSTYYVIYKTRHMVKVETLFLYEPNWRCRSCRSW